MAKPVSVERPRRILEVLPANPLSEGLSVKRVRKILRQDENGGWSESAVRQSLLDLADTGLAVSYWLKMPGNNPYKVYRLSESGIKMVEKFKRENGNAQYQ